MLGRMRLEFGRKETFDVSEWSDVNPAAVELLKWPINFKNSVPVSNKFKRRIL